MNTTVKLNVDQMVGFLMTVGLQSMFISAKSATKVKLNKFDRTPDKHPRPWSEVTKLAEVTGWLNVDYKRAVERKISKATGIPAAQIDYSLGEVWFKHLLTEDGKKTPVVVNKEKEDGKFYIFYFHRKTKSARYVAPNGEPITWEQMTPWLPPPRPESIKPAVRALTLNNVRQLKARGLIVRST